MSVVTTSAGDDDRRKAQVFFGRGNMVADTANYDYAIEMYISGLAIDSENIDAHQALREISLKRKAEGGKDLGILQKMKLSNKGDDKRNMLNAEKLLAYDPTNKQHMANVLASARAAGFTATAEWIAAILGANDP